MCIIAGSEFDCLDPSEDSGGGGGRQRRASSDDRHWRGDLDDGGWIRVGAYSGGRRGRQRFGGMGAEPGASLFPLALRAPQVPLLQPVHFATFFAVADTFTGRLSLTGRKRGGKATSRRTYQDELAP